MQILPSSFSTPLGGDPLEGEGIRFTCIMELAVSAGELQLTSTDPQVQPHLDYRYFVDPWDRERMREAVRLCFRLLDHKVFRVRLLLIRGLHQERGNAWRASSSH